MDDIIGIALLDYQNGHYSEDIKTFSSLDEEDTIPIPYLFRPFKAMPKLEQIALKKCSGKVLDIGCGSGSHSLYLQENGSVVTGLDKSSGAIKVCQQRGLINTVCSPILEYSGSQFDTLLLLMNGIGIAGSLDQLGNLLNHFKSLLKPNGQILLDSSNIIYMFEQDEDGGYWVPDNNNYYGEVVFQMGYKGIKGKSFKWLYLDFDTLKKYANIHGFHCKLVSDGEHFDYLAKLTLTP